MVSGQLPGVFVPEEPHIKDFPPDLVDSEVAQNVY